MKKMIFIILVLVSIVSVGASEARMKSLGNPIGFIRNMTDVFFYPGSINYYERMVIAEMEKKDSDDDWVLGANLSYKNSVIGIYLNRSSGLDVDKLLRVEENYHNHSNYLPRDLDISKKIDLIVGFGENLGLKFSLANDSNSYPYSVENVFYEVEQRADYVELGAGTSDDFFDLGISMKLARARVKNTYSGEKLSSLLYGFELNGRKFFKSEDNVKEYILTAKISYEQSRSKYKVEETADETDDRKGQLTAEVGAGLNYLINEKNSLIFAFKPFSYQGYSVETPWEFKVNKRTISAPKIYLGIESIINNWLIARAGANQSFDYHYEKSDSINNNSVVYKSQSTDFDMNLGLGFKFGSFKIDTVLIKSFLFDGPNFIGGSGRGIASSLSLIYEF